MTYSIVIPTKNRPVDLRYSLRSIVNQTLLPKEVIIIDASSDSTSTENERSCAEILGNCVKMIYQRSPSGVNKQRNTGADIATAEIVFFLDDDVKLNSDYSEKIIEVYKAKGNCNVGGVQGCIKNYYNESWINRAYKKLFFMTRVSVNEESRFLPSLGYVYILSPKNIIEVQAMPSLICSYYRTVFNEFRFDETFHRCTDLEISYRISKAYKLYQTPYAVATHHHTEETHMNIKKLNRSYIIHMHKLMKKHMPGRINNKLAYFWSIIGELIMSAAKSGLKFNSDAFIGTVDGLKTICLKNVDVEVFPDVSDCPN
ncbi:MAG: glycosyltransferase family 2 protein [Nitrospiraceae bacterium]|nr:MAG: glycosyltransferase family 2 protein [Nitrospiraceae bacterium]